MQYTEIGSIAEKYWVKMKDSFDNLIIYVKENLLKWENEKNNPENVFM